MFKLFKKVKNYLVAFFTYKFDEKADPRIQLQQAMTQYQTQHQQLKEQAARVIANQKSTEMSLNKALKNEENIKGQIKTAILMAEDASKSGDETKATEYTNSAEVLSGQLVAVENEVVSLQQQQIAAVQNAQKAKQAVTDNAMRLQEQITNQRALLSKLDQAKMQEETNSALASLTDTIGGDVPSLAEVEKKIDDRYALAVGTAELQSDSVEGRMMEIEAATRNQTAKSRLEQMKMEVLGTGEAQPVAQIQEKSEVKS